MNAGKGVEDKDWMVVVMPLISRDDGCWASEVKTRGW